MRSSDILINRLKKFEQLRLTAYQDAFFHTNLYPSILAVDIDKAGKEGGGPQLAERTGECRYCTNLISVDTTNKLLKIKRYGVTADKYLRTITAFCYDYQNNVLISSF